jgi:hypothetical protein
MATSPNGDGSISANATPATSSASLKYLQYPDVPSHLGT